MKQFTCMFVLILALGACNQKDTKQTDSSKTDSTAVAEHSVGTIPEIQSEVTRIDATQKDSTVANFNCDAPGTVKYFKDKTGKIIKIGIDWGFTGDFSSTSDLYYNNDKIIYMHQTMIGAAAGMPEDTTVEQMFVSKDKVIRFMSNGKDTICDKCGYTDSSWEYKVLKAFPGKDVQSAICL